MTKPNNKYLHQPLKVLITRPEKAAIELAALLNQHDIGTLCHAMFAYQSVLSPAAINSLSKDMQHGGKYHQHPPIIIFVSAAAVEYAEQAIPLSQWQYSTVIAVGSATRAALNKLNVTAICPPNYDSEGMLSLTELKHVRDKTVVIVRGDGGRELLAQQLTQRGANVQYIESYQRVWKNLPKTTLTQWRQQQVNGIVITSNALLESVVHLLLAQDNYWKNSCLWVFASERIAQNAAKYGLKHVINANGASNQSMLTALENYGIRS